MFFERADSTSAIAPVRASSWVVSVVAVLAASCRDGNERCDAHQVLQKTSDGTEYCACAAGTIMDPKGYGCLPCGHNEEVSQGSCACLPGYDRPTADAGCEETVGQPIGSPCNEDTPCADPYPYCVTDDSERYCTKDECTPGGCPAGYSCTAAEGVDFCARLPTGLGQPCTATGNECATFEANFCESFMTMLCFVNDCATGQKRCPGEYGCCDLSPVTGFPLSLCFAPSQLPGGSCPIGNLVTP